MTLVDQNPAKREAILDPSGAISVYGGYQVPTGRKRYRHKHYSGFGDLDPINTRYMYLTTYRGEQLKAFVAEMDNEELKYGVTRCDDGKFSITAAYDRTKINVTTQNLMKKTLLARANDVLAGSVMDAINSIIEIATSPMSEDKDKQKAAQWIVERTLGKTPDIVVHTQDKPFETVLTNIQRGKRADSRRMRELPPSGRMRPDGTVEEPLEAEIVETANSE